MRGRLAVIVVAAAAVALVAARYLGWIAPTPGPLHAPAGAQAGTNAAAGSTMTAAFRVIESDVDGPVELRAAEAVGVDGNLDVAAAQVLVCRTERFCAPSYTLRGWPPRGAVPEPVDGYVVDGDRDTRTIIGVPVTLPEEPGRYRLRGVRIDYAQGLRRYRAEVGPNLVFVVLE